MSNKQRNKQAHISTGNGVLGGLLGSGLGYLGGGLFGGQRAKDTGKTIGGALGSLLPFQQGGIVMPVKKVKRGRGKGTKAMKAKMQKLRAMRK
jgi:hypothetical protein